MSRNLLVKASTVPGEEMFRKTTHDVRTDFILQNVYAYILGNRYQYNAVCAENKKEEKVLERVKDIVKDFQCKYASDLRNMCSEIQVTEETVGSILIGVANEVFYVGITWSRILALFVFVGELAVECLSNNLPLTVVDVVYECFSTLVKEKLEAWVYDHDGWECFGRLSTPKSCKPGWFKSLLYSTVRLIGNVAQIKN